MHAAIGRVQIQKMFPIAQKRRQVVEALKEALKDVPAFRFAPISERSQPSYWFWRILLNTDAVCVDKQTFCKALEAEGLPIGIDYPATPYTFDWYQNSVVFGNSGYPWAAPEYTGDKQKRYTLEDVPVVKKALKETFILFLNESWTQTNIEETAAAMKKVYNAYKK